jgi:hypothetical protein
VPLESGAQYLEPNIGRDAAVRESGLPLSNNEIEFRKADGCRLKVKFL